MDICITLPILLLSTGTASDNFLINDAEPGTIKTKSSNFYLPMNLGIDLHITKVTMLNINYQMNYAFSDYVDGYKFSRANSLNLHNDLYSALIFGLHFYIGEISMTPNRK